MKNYEATSERYGVTMAKYGANSEIWSHWWGTESWMKHQALKLRYGAMTELRQNIKPLVRAMALPRQHMEPMVRGEVTGEIWSDW